MTNDDILPPPVLRRPPVFDGDCDEPKQDTSVGKVIAMTTIAFMVDCPFVDRPCADIVRYRFVAMTIFLSAPSSSTREQTRTS